MLSAADRVFAAAFVGILLPVLADSKNVGHFIGLAREVFPKVNRAHALIAPLALHFNDVDCVLHWASAEQRQKRTRWLMDAADIATAYLLSAATDGVRSIRGERA